MVAQPSFFVQSVGTACPTVLQAVIVFLSVSLPQEADSKISAPAHSQFLILNVASMVISTLESCTAAMKFTMPVHHILTLVCLTKGPIHSLQLFPWLRLKPSLSPAAHLLIYTSRLLQVSMLSAALQAAFPCWALALHTASYYRSHQSHHMSQLRPT